MTHPYLPLRFLVSLTLMALLASLVGAAQPGFGQAATPPPASTLTASARQVADALGPGQKALFTIFLRDQLALPDAPAPTAQLGPASAAARRAAQRQSAEQALQAHATRTQPGVLAAARALQTQGRVGRITSFWIFNGLSIEADAQAIQSLAARADVLQISPDPDPAHPIAPADLSPQPPPRLGEGERREVETLSLPLIPRAAGNGSGDGVLAPANLTPQPPLHIIKRGGQADLLPPLPHYVGKGSGDEVSALAAPIQPNITLVNAPAMWALGFRGQGVVVATLDTGVDYTHPDLAFNWRGGNNSWFDPYGQHATPFDASGHGTHVMGILAGGSSDPTVGAIGMAPGAKWISAKIFNDSGGYTEANVHLAFQWALDPDGNPATPDGADLVNNSWGYTAGGQCQLNFQVDIQNLRAAGVLPVFSSGNQGLSTLASDTSPSNNPGAFGVGAIDNTSSLYALSSRGPSTCNAALFYPALTAPGVNILSAWPVRPAQPLYQALSGTSMAAPHAAGALALLLSALPGLPLTLQEQALQQGAFDLGAPGFDFSFGYGRLDALAVYQWAKANWALPYKAFVPVLRKSVILYFPIVAGN